MTQRKIKVPPVPPQTSGDDPDSLKRYEEWEKKHGADYNRLVAFVRRLIRRDKEDREESSAAEKRTTE